MPTKIKYFYPNIEQLSSDLSDNILKLNELNKPALGAIINLDNLIKLYNQSAFVICVFKSKILTSFAIVMDESSTYKSPNYLYFKNKFPKFLYVDRIAVTQKHQRKGIGSLIYSEIFQLGIKMNAPICCEVNTKPLNQKSLNFHKKNNFRIIDEVPFVKKSVAMMVKR